MRRSGVLLLVATAIAGCEGSQSVLDPGGYSAARIEELWWVMFALGMVVWAIVVALAVYVLFRKRRHDSERPISERTEGDSRATRWVVGATAVTLVILVAVFGFSVATGRAIQGLVSSEPLIVEVTGHQWWWEVEYIDSIPGRRFTTANEIHIPVGRSVRIQLRSNDVVHSFWVPNLAGKTDLVPGRSNTLWIRAEEPGIYRGQCAQFCGLQHANMALVVVVETPEDYAAWAANQLQPARVPADSLTRRGQEVFLSRGCVLCHTVRGTLAQGDVAPDLTHLASRRTLASGILPNTRGHLGGWIGNPQVIKPGNRMPRVPLEGDELQALLAYLESLD